MTHPSDDVPEEHLLGQFIPLHYHFNMLRDETRMRPFQDAIALTVPEGGMVLELGGGTGVLSWFAAQKARQVYCVERNPALVRAARSFLANNPHGERVNVIQADAMTYLPPEPVDVVICEMLHVGMIREKQLAVLQSFKERYSAAFGPRLPTFIPDTTLLAIQPIEQDFSFSGYHAAVPMFEPAGPHMADRWLGEPHIYSTIDYRQELPQAFQVDTVLTMQRPGQFNALSFLTNNFLAFDLSEQRAAQWMMNQLILPLAEPLDVKAGDSVAVQFEYAAGCSLESLTESLSVTRRALAIPMRAEPLKRRAA
ncbi:MAG TPA: methyltransferase domain-containing protein [Planctomycetaceae bacterium]|nr:methyltransferase domain-containing protein [Planctomycetaceae bacterium]